MIVMTLDLLVMSVISLVVSVAAFQRFQAGNVTTAHLGHLDFQAVVVKVWLLTCSVVRLIMPPPFLECNCSKSGAESEICQTFDGQCGCLPNTDGMTCSQCISGFYNLTAGVGCYDCECNSDGSELPDCNQLDGRCACKNGVSGEKCDRCDDGYFGFSENGCR